ncbi:MAG: hypothetical protein ACT4PM_05475, partial [Gemmatimonadales bacterium]
MTMRGGGMGMGRSGGQPVGRSAIRYSLFAIRYSLIPVAAIAGCQGGGNAFYEARGTVEVHEVDFAAPVA